MRSKQAAVIAAGLLLLSNSTAHAAAKDGPVAIGSTAAVGAVLAFACWAAQHPAYDEPGPQTTAEEEDGGGRSYARTGWYVGLEANAARGYYADDEEDALQQALAPFEISVAEAPYAFGLTGRAGNRCHEHFATEVAVHWLTGFDGEVIERVQGTIGEFFLESLVGTVNVKGYPLTGRLQPFALVGMGAMTVSAETRDTAGPGADKTSEETMFVVRFGVGLDFYLTKQIVATTGLDYVLPVSGISNLSYIALGLGVDYRF